VTHLVGYEKRRSKTRTSLVTGEETGKSRNKTDKVTETNDEPVADVVKAKVKGGDTDMAKVFIVHTNGFHRDDDGRNPS